MLTKEIAHVLADEQGPIPTFPPLPHDETGRVIMPSAEELNARNEAARRMLKAIARLTDETDDDDRWIESL